MRAKVDAQALRHKPVRRLFCAAVLCGSAKLADGQKMLNYHSFPAFLQTKAIEIPTLPFFGHVETRASTVEGWRGRMKGLVLAISG